MKQAVPVNSLTDAADAGKHRVGRVVPSRHAYRWKPWLGFGVLPIGAVRWRAFGHHGNGPDIFDLKRHSPTSQTSTVNVFLQIAPSLVFKLGKWQQPRFLYTQISFAHQDPSGQIYKRRIAAHPHTRMNSFKQSGS